MTDKIKVGDRVPAATLLRMGPEGPEQIDLSARLAGRRVVLFALPGAFTPTCDSAHLPSFIRNMAALGAKGVDEVICLSVNDTYVMKLWGETSGATAAGITMLSDGDAGFTKAVGMAYSVPATGFYDRSRRYVMVIEDGTVTHFQQDVPGTCALSTGEAILEVL